MLNLCSKITDKSHRDLVNFDYFWAIRRPFPKWGRGRRKTERSAEEVDVDLHSWKLHPIPLQLLLLPSMLPWKLRNLEILSMVPFITKKSNAPQHCHWIPTEVLFWLSLYGIMQKCCTGLLLKKLNTTFLN